MILISCRMLKRFALLLIFFALLIICLPSYSKYIARQKIFALSLKLFLHSSSIFFALLLFGGRWLRHNWRLEISDPTFILFTHPTPKSNHLSDVHPFYKLLSIFINFPPFYPILISKPTFILSTHPTPKSNHPSDVHPF